MIDDQFREENLSMWKEVVTSIFNDIPEEAIWTKIDEITSILRRFTVPSHLNHMFYPTGGGNDLEGVNLSAEENCIELVAGGGVEIVRPKHMQFVCLDGDTEWSYLRIESLPLKPCGIYEAREVADEDSETEYSKKMRMRETVVEVDTLDYRDINQYQYGVMEHDDEGNEIPYPESSRVVTRYFEGSFVVYPKTSAYNEFGPTYDGRHNKMNAEEFKKYIADMKAIYTKHRKDNEQNG